MAGAANESAGDRVGLKNIQNPEQVIGRVLKPGGRRAVQRNVKMYPPFRRLRVREGGGCIERGRKVFEREPAAGRKFCDHLVQIDIIRKSAQRLAGLRRGP